MGSRPPCQVSKPFKSHLDMFFVLSLALTCLFLGLFFIKSCPTCHVLQGLQRTVSVCLPKPSLSLGQALFSHKPEGLNNVLVTKLGNVRIVANSVFFSFH